MPKRFQFNLRTLIGVITLAAVERLAVTEPTGRPSKSAILQMRYLVELESGLRCDFERLAEINIGLLTIRELQPSDSVVEERLCEVATFRSLQFQYSPFSVVIDSPLPKSLAVRLDPRFTGFAWCVAALRHYPLANTFGECLLSVVNLRP